MARGVHRTNEGIRAAAHMTLLRLYKKRKTRARQATDPKTAAPKSRVIVPEYCPPPWLSTQCVIRPFEW